DPMTKSSGLLSCDQGGATTSKDVENDATALGAIEDRVGYQSYRFNGRVHGKFGISIAAKGVEACVVPDIASVSTKATQFNVVDMWGAALLEHEDQFMLRAVKASHASVGLRPDTEVLEFAVWCCSRVQ